MAKALIGTGIPWRDARPGRRLTILRARDASRSPATGRSSLDFLDNATDTKTRIIDVGFRGVPVCSRLNLSIGRLPIGQGFDRRRQA